MWHTWGDGEVLDLSDNIENACHADGTSIVNAVICYDWLRVPSLQVGHINV